MKGSKQSTVPASQSFSEMVSDAHAMASCGHSVSQIAYMTNNSNATARAAVAAAQTAQISNINSHYGTSYPGLFQAYQGGHATNADLKLNNVANHAKHKF